MKEKKIMEMINKEVFHFSYFEEYTQFSKEVFKMNVIEPNNTGDDFSSPGSSEGRSCWILFKRSHAGKQVPLSA